MLCLIHGYALTGSGSKIWTRAVTQALCRSGETMHIVYQERRPEQHCPRRPSQRHHLIWAVMPRVGERWLRTWSKGGSADDLFPPVSVEVTRVLCRTRPNRLLSAVPMLGCRG